MKEINLLVGYDGFFGQTRKPWVSIDTLSLVRELERLGYAVQMNEFHEVVNDKVKIENKKEFWKSAPVTPQGLYARLDYLIEYGKEYMSQEDEKTIEYLNKLFGGGHNG